MIKVVIVDDVRLLRESLKHTIEMDKDIEVIATAENGEEALALCEKLFPDVVLMDIVMPVCDGLLATKLIKDRNKSVNIIILTTLKDEESILRAYDYGADGYILKDVNANELILAIKSVANGFKVLHRNVLEDISIDLHIRNKKTADNEESFKCALSNRELGILRLIAQGKSNKEIASLVNLSEGRIKNIITGILRKFDLQDRTQLAVYAVQKKIV